MVKKIRDKIREFQRPHLVCEPGRRDVDLRVAIPGLDLVHHRGSGEVGRQVVAPHGLHDDELGGGGSFQFQLSKRNSNSSQKWVPIPRYERKGFVVPSTSTCIGHLRTTGMSSRRFNIMLHPPTMPLHYTLPREGFPIIHSGGVRVRSKGGEEISCLDGEVPACWASWSINEKFSCCHVLHARSKSIVQTFLFLAE